VDYYIVFFLIEITIQCFQVRPLLFVFLEISQLAIAELSMVFMQMLWSVTYIGMSLRGDLKLGDTTDWKPALFMCQTNSSLLIVKENICILNCYVAIDRSDITLIFGQAVHVL